jgi:hypothetical protein
MELDWEDVYRAGSGEQTDLLEHAWRREPVRALARTWWRMAWCPHRVWAVLTPHSRFDVRAIVVLVLLQGVVFAYGWWAMAVWLTPLMNGIGAWLAGGQNVVPLSFRYVPLVAPDFHLNMALWYVGALLIHCCFFDRTHCPGRRWPHQLRVWVCATAFAALCPAIWCLLEALIDSLHFVVPSSATRLRAPLIPRRTYYLLAQGMFAVGVIVTWMHLWEGYRRYLRLPHGWAIAALVLAAGHVLGDALRTIILLFDDGFVLG